MIIGPDSTKGSALIGFPSGFFRYLKPGPCFRQLIQLMVFLLLLLLLSTCRRFCCWYLIEEAQPVTNRLIVVVVEVMSKFPQSCLKVAYREKGKEGDNLHWR